MQAQLLDTQSGRRTFALIFETGDEVIRELERFAARERLAASHFTAIGAFSRLTVAFFRWESKSYEQIAIDEQVEVLTLAGDVARQGDQPKIHAHVVVGKRDGTAHGGHLVEAHVRPTLEVILTESPAHLQREMDAETGLALIRPR